METVFTQAIFVVLVVHFALFFAVFFFSAFTNNMFLTFVPSVTVNAEIWGTLWNSLVSLQTRFKLLCRMQLDTLYLAATAR